MIEQSIFIHLQFLGETNFIGEIELTSEQIKITLVVHDICFNLKHFNYLILIKHVCL